MPLRANFWLKVLPMLTLIVLILSVFSLRIVPPTNIRGYTSCRDGQQGSMVLPWNKNEEGASAPEAASAAWRLNLRLGGSRSSPAWRLYEGDRPGSGYELHWQPQDLVLQLFRSGSPTLLGSVYLKQNPTQVVFARHGYHLLVQADDVTVLQCLDPLPNAPARVFGLSESGPMPDSTFSLHDDHVLVDVDTLASIAITKIEDIRALLNDRKRPDHAILSVRYALSLDPVRTLSEAVTAIELAGVAVRELAVDDPDRAQLQHWLTWGEARLAMAYQYPDASQRTALAIRQLSTLGTKMPACENLGLLLDVIDRIALICKRPSFTQQASDGHDDDGNSRTPRWPREWFDVLSFAASTALDACPGKAQPAAPLAPALDEEWRWQLRLVMHAAQCLRGPPGPGDIASADPASKRAPWPLPTPNEAPDWAISRWSAFAFNDPRTASFSPIPTSDDEINPIHTALDDLIVIAGFDPLAAVVMRAHILDALDSVTVNSRPDERRAAEQRANDAAHDLNVPTTESVLAVALLALHGSSESQQEALTELDPDPKHQSSLSDGNTQWPPPARRNALAYALYRLIQHRISENSPVPVSPAPTAPEAVPYGMLDVQNLPPAQARAALLAMREVNGLSTDWDQLDQIPCYTLPLKLMKHSRAPADKPGKDHTGIVP